MSNVYDAAREYYGRGWQPLPLDGGSKNPNFPEWQHFSCSVEELSFYFTGRGNIGLLTGTPSRGLVDTDIDCSEALALAPHFLPATGLISGRPGNPQSHYWYQAETEHVATFKRLDPTRRQDDAKAMLIELRGTGAQTLVPPSSHDKDRDQYLWHSFGEPTKVQVADLRRAIQQVAIGALLVRYWPGKGARHDSALPIAGLFLSTGWLESDAALLVYVVARAAGHQKPGDRKDAVHATYRSHAAGKPTTGIPELKKYLPPVVVDTLVGWCREISPNPDAWKQRQSGNGPAPDTDWGDTARPKDNPWAQAMSAPDFLAEEEKEFKGLAKDLVAPGAITLIASPKGIGKTQVIHALAVALGSKSGVFRGERVEPVRVLLIDRENPRAVVKKRLRAWGAAMANNLKILTRQQAPDLKDRAAWEAFPVEDYDVVIVDSVGASTEGITEKEGKQNSEVLATLLDLAHRDVAIILLQNTEKTGTNIRGRGEWADRSDIQYEVRDATGFTPSGKRPWWLELPDDGAADWAARAARRKGRTDYRLGFIPAKFRLDAEPDPFCIEIALPKDEPWTLRDVTAEVIQSGEETVAKAEQAKSEKLKKAAESLATAVKERALSGESFLKEEATDFLCTDHALSRKAARTLIAEKDGILWKIHPVPGGKGKGTPKALFPIEDPSSKKMNGGEEPPLKNPHETEAEEEVFSAARMKPSGGEEPPTDTAENAGCNNSSSPPPHSMHTAEKNAQKTPSNGGPESGFFSAAEEVQTDERSAAEGQNEQEREPCPHCTNPACWQAPNGWVCTLPPVTLQPGAAAPKKKKARTL